MAKINKLFGPGEYIVLKDITVRGYREICLLEDTFETDIRFSGVRPRYMDLIIPAKSIVSIIRHEKNYSNGIFVSEIDLTCSDDSFFSYSCVIEGDTCDVLKELDGVSKVLYGDF